MAKITTITSYWERPDILPVWLEAVRGSTIPEVEHILFFVGDPAPAIPNPPKRLRVVDISKTDPFSIGHCHNIGARMANTEWIMKIDIDSLPSLMFFRKLIPLIEGALPREWFNCGMLYFKAIYGGMLGIHNVPVGPAFHHMVCQNMRSYSAFGYDMPASTNFICRTQDYLGLGGCDKRFDGYGWEDYQQIYMLERYQQGKDPLPGPVTFDNVTQRCRDEISRSKARELYQRDEVFCLFHRWHSICSKNRQQMDKNRQLLLDYILEARRLSLNSASR
jgi:hypothetical protein